MEKFDTVDGDWHYNPHDEEEFEKLSPVFKERLETHLCMTVFGIVSFHTWLNEEFGKYTWKADFEKNEIVFEGEEKQRVFPFVVVCSQSNISNSLLFMFQREGVFEGFQSEDQKKIVKGVSDENVTELKKFLGEKRPGPCSRFFDGVHVSTMAQKYFSSNTVLHMIPTPNPVDVAGYFYVLLPFSEARLSPDTLFRTLIDANGRFRITRRGVEFLFKELVPAAETILEPKLIEWKSKVRVTFNRHNRIATIERNHDLKKTKKDE